jgi:hypothetical protein
MTIQYSERELHSVHVIFPGNFSVEGREGRTNCVDRREISSYREDVLQGFCGPNFYSIFACY